MRVRAFSGSAGNDPNWACSQFYNFGETEDYRINIQDAIAPTAAFTTPGNVMCAETNINFTNTSINATSYFWTFDGGVPATWVDPNPIVSFSLGGVYLITLTATNAFGTSTFSQNIGINAPVAIAGNDTTICLGTTTQLNASGGITYLWNPPTGLSADNVANPVATPLISTLYSVTVNDGNCTAQENVLITVNPLPTPIISDSSNYLVVDSNLYYLYQWDLNGINISGATFPNVFPNQIGDYTLTVTDNNGCSATSNMINVTVVGVKNLITDNIIIVYPNPASQSFYLRFNPDIEILTIKLLDLAGKILIDKTVSNISKNQLIKFDIDDLSEGIYYLQAKGNENVFTKKIEIIR
jgi:PKD repeat protein